MRSLVSPSPHRPSRAFAHLARLACPGLVAVAGVLGLGCEVGISATVSPAPGPAAAPEAVTPSTPEGEPPPSPTDAGRPAPEAGADARAPDAGPAPAIATFGRWDTRDAAGPRAAWPGSKLRFRFRGAEAAVTLDELPGAGGPSEWDVALDGVWRSEPLVLTPGRATYPLAEGLPVAEHSVELYRRTEAVGGRTQLVGVSLGAGALLPPPAPRRRVFEFLGDSLTNGYGIAGPGPQCPYSAATQNFHTTFAAQVASALDADEVGVAYQGKGLTKNYQRSNALLFPELYGRALPDDALSAWAPARLVPDAIFVMVGANDFLQERAQVFDPPDLAAFEAAYEALLARARANAPQAHIFALVGPTQTDATPARYGARTDQTAAVTTAVEARQRAGDARVHYVALEPEPTSELAGCDYHPSQAVHDRAAAELIPAVKALAGY